MAPRKGPLLSQLTLFYKTLFAMNTTRIHVFRITDPTENIKIARLSPASASDLSTYIQTPRDYRVSMVGTEQVKAMTSKVTVVDPRQDNNDVSDFEGAPFGVSVIYTSEDISISKSEARSRVEEAMGLSGGALGHIKVISGYPGQNNNPKKMKINSSTCQVSNVEGGYTTFKLTNMAEETTFRAAIVDWASGVNADRQIAVFEEETDEFVSLQDPTTHDLGATVQGADRISMNDEFDIQVTGSPIGWSRTYKADSDQDDLTTNPTEIEASKVCKTLQEVSPMVALTEEDGDAYSLESPSSVKESGPSDHTCIRRPKTAIQALGGASISGFVRKDKTANAPMDTDKVRLVELENLFE